MSYIIDANVLMGALISGKSFYKTVFQQLNPLLPQFALTEIEKYSETIINKSKLKDDELKRFTIAIFQPLTILPTYYLSDYALRESTRLIGETDPKDVAYLALAIQLNGVLLTRDQPIYREARSRGFRRIMLFDDFLRTHL
ncbi:PIN domain-containing protein [Spirosoma montaniterrae]|uniref:DNA-binding protein n=1 Tax=Spirosoma montaniterrae TaxID=1178516 RepID=A0A1P9X3H0_9BACT|nr:PIN domain-containing protein [Spirosoma montaniterrae]AQG82180.1 DNA-binding protein [Spirosoma montaniterrae]